MNFPQIIEQSRLALTFQRAVKGLGIDIGIAVAVSANPRSHPKERRDLSPAKPVLDRRVKMRDFLEKARRVIA